MDKYPDKRPKESLDDVLANCLWMFDKIEEMGEEDSKKAARWIGWAAGRMEAMGFLDNTETRNIIRVDVKNGDC